MRSRHEIDQLTLLRLQYLMVDVVVNHNAYWGSPSSIDYSKFTPFNDEKYYHSYCPINYNDENNAVSLHS